MKLTILALIAAVSLSISASAQFLLAPGASYTFQFDTLPFIGMVPEAPGQGIGVAAYYLNPASGTPGAILINMEMFEGSTNETQIAGGVGSQFVNVPALGAWQDLQGVIRITSIAAETLTLDSIMVSVTKPVPGGGFAQYGTGLLAVPEPSTLALLGAGVVAALGWHLRKRTRRHARNLTR